MFAPVGKRWSLAVIRWWGGWSVGEHHYNFHGDALRPIPTEADKTFMGDHVLLSSVTAQEIQEMTASIQRRFDSLTLTSVTAQPICHSCSQHVHSSAISLPTIPNPPNPPIHTPPMASASHDVPMIPAPHKQSQCSAQPPETPLTRECIPWLPQGESAWKEALKQWNEGDINAGLLTALKDWPETWYTKKQSKFFCQLYIERARVAAAYASCGDDETAFISKYPEAQRGWKALRLALRRDFGGKARASKNGPAGERNS
ncbi:hypothetical protein C8J56DRAFT_892474 [Mycena floridula]|nr:hypothetical protein C8J56DRAFT_892474 [Mycena floridula]